MQAYHFDTNGYFLSSSELRTNPLDKKSHLIPAFSTLIEPPECDKNQIAKWDGQGWIILPDFRGTEYWAADAKHNDLPVTIDKPGITPPEGALLSAPAEPLELRIERLRDEVKRFHTLIKEHYIPSNLSDLYQLKCESAKAIIAAKDGVPPAEDLSLLEPEAKTRCIEVTELARIIIAKNMVAKTSAGIIEAGRFWANELIDGIKDEVGLIEVSKLLEAKKIELSRKFELDSGYVMAD